MQVKFLANLETTTTFRLLQKPVRAGIPVVRSVAGWFFCALTSQDSQDLNVC